MVVFRLAALLWLGMWMSPVQAQALSIQVLDATAKGVLLADAEVQLSQGSLQASGRTDAQGRVSLDIADAATAQLLIRKTGYADLRAQCPCQGLNFAMSPVLNDPQSLRVVLSWNTPGEDLDAHLSYPHRLLYYATGSGPGARMEVDSTDSSGPETITIEQPK